MQGIAYNGSGRTGGTKRKRYVLEGWILEQKGRGGECVCV